jgi:hypothetical protein
MSRDAPLPGRRLAPLLAALIVSVFRCFTVGARIARSYQASIKRPRRLARPRTPAFHVGNTGSNPVGDAKEIKSILAICCIVAGLTAKFDSHGIRKGESLRLPGPFTGAKRERSFVGCGR